MADFTVRTAQQLPLLLRALRQQAGLTQAAVAMRMGITQQALSAMERNADAMSAGRLLHLLSILGADLVLRERGKSLPPIVSEELPW